MRNSETVFLPRRPRERVGDSETVFLLRTNCWIHLQRRYCLVLKLASLICLLMHLDFALKCPFHWQILFVTQSPDVLSEDLQYVPLLHAMI
jgi:hypothetical protein